MFKSTRIAEIMEDAEENICEWEEHLLGLLEKELNDMTADQIYQVYGGDQEVIEDEEV